MSHKSKSSVSLSDHDRAELLCPAIGSVIILLSTDGCFPCTLIKPLLRKLAVEFQSQMVLVEVMNDVVRQFTKAHGIDRFPTMLMVRDSTIVDRKNGYHGSDETRATVLSFLEIADEDASSSEEIAFQRAVAEANDMIETIMQASSDALMPHIEAIKPELQAVEDRVEADRLSGRLTSIEAQQRRMAELKALYRPFQDKIDALSAAQGLAVTAYETRMNEGVQVFAATTSLSLDPRLICSADGSTCWVPN